MSTKNGFIGKIRPKSNGCWEWTGCRDSRGYGSLTYKQRRFTAHRFSFAYFIGSIPDGLNVLHKCDNVSCVNPSHLYLGTQVENMTDRSIRNPLNTGGGQRGKRRGPNVCRGRKTYKTTN